MKKITLCIIASCMLTATAAFSETENSNVIRFFSQKHGKNEYLKMRSDSEHGSIFFEHCFVSDDHCEMLGSNRGYDPQLLKEKLATLKDDADGMVGKTVQWMLHPVWRTIKGAAYAGGAAALIEGGRARDLPFFLLGGPALMIGCSIGGVLIGGAVVVAGTSYLIFNNPKKIGHMVFEVTSTVGNMIKALNFEILSDALGFLKDHSYPAIASVGGAYAGHAYMPAVFEAVGLSSGVHNEDIVHAIENGQQGMTGWIIIEDFDHFMERLNKLIRD